MIAGVCLLVVLTIAECRINLGFTPSPKQSDDCGDPSDNSTKLGQCAELTDDATEDYDYDYDEFCDAGCLAVVEEYYEYMGFDDIYGYILDELGETCDVDTDSTIPTVETDESDDAVTVSAISTVTAILVAIAVALN